MKRLPFLPILVLSLIFTSCEKDSDVETTTVAIPVTQSLSEFRASVEIQEARSIRESGKIYVWKDYIFINDKNEGVHIIDNTDRYSPKKISFLKIPRNTDIAIKDEKLYANNGMDLVVFELSDMNNIKETGRIKDVFPYYYQAAPEGATYIDLQDFDATNQVIIGYVMETKKKEQDRMMTWQTLDMFNNAAAEGGGRTGTGGSMARFSIVNDYLYIADESKLSVFDITNNDPSLLTSEQVGWQIETIFHYDNHLYLGSSRGMFIFSLEDPTAPHQLSYLQHVRGCDPVVVKDNFAYVTIRGGNACGQDFNQLDVVDISDKQNPVIVGSFEMNNPYGLGVKDDWLFVCDDDAGLKVFDIKDTPDLRLIDQFSNINTYDVIPLEDMLLMVGDNTLYQYSYKGNEISLISSFAIN